MCIVCIAIPNECQHLHQTGSVLRHGNFPQVYCFERKRDSFEVETNIVSEENSHFFVGGEDFIGNACVFT